MKEFITEYGFVALAAIVLIIIIGIAPRLGNKVEESTNSMVDGFAETTNQWFNSVNTEAAGGSGGE